ncbi:MAG: carbohydrate ABC transporter permease [Thermomicrobiales bacterium]|nr:carbohydrate ABC transporter permease [Thermomicrobiales bacterium]
MIDSTLRNASGRRRSRLSILRPLAAAVVAALFLIPLVWLVIASLRPTGLPTPAQIQWWPAPATFRNYRDIFRIVPMARYALNSAIVVIAVVPLTLLTTSMAGFAMTQLSKRWRDAFVAVLVAALMVPVMSVWLTRFMVYKWLGVLDTLGALIVPGLMGSSPLYVLIMFWAFRRVPQEAFEAARIDGAGPFRTWWSIGIPQVRPGLLAVTVLSFERHWGNFLDPLLYINDPKWYTLPVALQGLQQLHPSDWPLMMAAAVLVTIPAIAVFIVAQRHFLREYDEGNPFR